MSNHACSFFSSKEKKIKNRFFKLFSFFLLQLPLNCELVCVFDWNFGRGVGWLCQTFFITSSYIFSFLAFPPFLFAPRVIFLSPALDLSSFQRFCRVCMKEIHLDSYYSVVCLLSSTNRSINPCGFLSTPKVECEELSLLLFRYFPQILEIKRETKTKRNAATKKGSLITRSSAAVEDTHAERTWREVCLLFIDLSLVYCRIGEEQLDSAALWTNNGH